VYPDKVAEISSQLILCYFSNSIYRHSKPQRDDEGIEEHRMWRAFTVSHGPLISFSDIELWNRQSIKMCSGRQEMT
jgi:hypothetical protein